MSANEPAAAPQTEPAVPQKSIEPANRSASSPTGSETVPRPTRYWQRRIRLGLVFTMGGLIVFLLGARPGMFGLDRSPVIGFIQIAVFLVGLAIVSVGGYATLMALWGDRQTSIAADIGSRLIATGYVIAVFAGMADIFGFGSQPLPNLPVFGPWQARGVEIGQALIGLGFLLLLPFARSEKPAEPPTPAP